MSLIVIGATSVIAQETAKVFFRAGHDLVLISRDTSSLNLFDFHEGRNGPAIKCLDCDISHSSSIETMTNRIIDLLDDDPYVLLAAGTIGGVDNYSDRLVTILEILDVNFRNVIAVTDLVSEELGRRENGCVIVLSSVAGDRGRQSNYIYGAAKAGLSVFAQGLRNKLFCKNVHVLTVKLGYVDTPMFRQSLGSSSDSVPSFLVGDPAKIAEGIFQAARKKKNVLYLGRVWWLIMILIRSIPEIIFKRLRL